MTPRPSLPCSGSKAFISYKRRGPEEASFFASLEQMGFNVEIAPLLNDKEYKLISLRLD